MPRIRTSQDLAPQSIVLATVTGTIAAALAQNSTVLFGRLSPTSQVRAYLRKMRLRWTTVVAFTTPITAGRQLALFRGAPTGAYSSSGGTELATLLAANSEGFASQFDSAAGGNVRVATTGTLTLNNVGWEPLPLEVLTLTAQGAAGAVLEQTFDFGVRPLVFNRGELWGIRNPVAMDAAGTWQLEARLEFTEGEPDDI